MSEQEASLNALESPEINNAAELAELESMMTEIKEDFDFFMNFYEQAGIFQKSLKDRYGSQTNFCCLFHLLGGSSLREAVVLTIFDFAGEDSIAEFIKKQHRLLKEKQLKS